MDILGEICYSYLIMAMIDANMDVSGVNLYFDLEYRQN